MSNRVIILTANTHAGAGLRNRGLRSLIKKHKPSLVSLQEVRRFSAITLNLILRMWYHTSVNHVGQVLLASKKDWELIKQTNTLISKGPKNKGYQPQRNLVTMILRHRKTGKIVAIGDVHTWAMGKGFNRHANKHVMAQHVHQVLAFADWADKVDNMDNVALIVLCGDFNENLAIDPQRIDPLVAHKSARAVMKESHMAPMTLSVHGKWEATGLEGGGAVLDEFFWKGSAKPISRHAEKAPGKGWDHRVVVGVWEL